MSLLAVTSPKRNFNSVAHRRLTAAKRVANLRHWTGSNLLDRLNFALAWFGKTSVKCYMTPRSSVLLSRAL